MNDWKLDIVQEFQSVPWYFKIKNSAFCNWLYPCSNRVYKTRSDQNNIPQFSFRNRLLQNSFFLLTITEWCKLIISILSAFFFGVCTKYILSFKRSSGNSLFNASSRKKWFSEQDSVFGKVTWGNKVKHSFVKSLNLVSTYDSDIEGHHTYLRQW